MSLYHGSPSIVTNGLILYLDAANKRSYPGSGTTWTDLSGNLSTGTLTNGPTYNSGNGGSIVFDGINDNVIVTPVPPLMSNYTVECTFNLTAFGSDNDLIAIAKDGAHGFLMELRGSDGAMRFLHRYPYSTTGGDSFYAPTGLTTNKVYHIAYTRDTNLKVYSNGNFVSSIAATVAGFDATANQLSIGSLGTTNLQRLIKGNVYSVRMYNRSLSATEIQQNYNALKGRYGL